MMENLQQGWFQGLGLGLGLEVYQHQISPQEGGLCQLDKLQRDQLNAHYC
jgi:hypothetical protein